MSLVIMFSPLIVILSLVFTRLLHPLAMGLSLLTQTVMICITAGLSMNSFWFSYILFLIFLGSMLVLFIYVASLASNETFSFSSVLLFFATSAIVLGVLCLMLDPLTLNLPTHVSPSSMMTDNTFFSIPSFLSAIYNNTTMNMTLFIVIYLLLTLIAVVKITNTFFGPLRLSV
uniref:NADH-ubiquinone oxidoreductase chain 6 n=1 Tax=Aristaeomorpha foliacea TaxID=2556126 RepID=A0A345UBR3_9EUCA|nr:NADH dehydrogenase subunit 6 [Aristaeomorpha foliacea]AXI97899.1 NADH dehydrogenase subunit 6 [Aristaeomorpha foliacea]